MPVIKYKDSNGNTQKMHLIVPMDSGLSSTSTNGVQNKVIKKAIDNKYTKPVSGIPASDIATGVIPDVSGKQDASDNSLTTTTKTVAGAINEVNGALAGMVNTSAIQTSVSSSSTDAQVPSAKLFYDTVGNIETLLGGLL